MAKQYDLASKLGTNLSRSMEDEKKYTAERFETEPGLKEFRAAARAEAAPSSVAPTEPPTGAEVSPASASPPVAADDAVTPNHPAPTRARRASGARGAKKGRADATGTEKPRLSYMLTTEDDEAINESMARAFTMQRRMSVSQVIRTAVRALARLDDDAFIDAIDSTPQVVRGRPIRGQ